MTELTVAQEKIVPVMKDNDLQVMATVVRNIMLMFRRFPVVGSVDFFFVCLFAFVFRLLHGCFVFVDWC